MYKCRACEKEWKQLSDGGGVCSCGAQDMFDEVAGGKQISRWADEAMYTAEPVEKGSGPRVYLLGMTADPLGHIAAGASMYVGKVRKSLAEVTHEERQYYFAEMQKTKLKAPLELVQFHFLFENVTRGFTHQLVRQRTAVYMQESMRFAVKEDMARAVALPPSLAGIDEERGAQLYGDYMLEGIWPANAVERQYLMWRAAVEQMSETYNNLISLGMPAEEARGLAPTSVMTRVHYGTNLRALLDHAGNRLCTQAQFEWRSVFTGIANAIRMHNPYTSAIRQCKNVGDLVSADTLEYLAASDDWQYEGIASLLQPVCYQVGKCVFEADFDRFCSIRERVNTGKFDMIAPEEWLADPGAARRPGPAGG